MQRNWYADTAAPAPERPPLSGPLEADVCVVGAGITGCSAALHLAQRGYRVAVIEARTVGYGASGRSGGQLIAGYNRGQDTLTRLVGAADARALWDLGEEALTLTRALIAEHAITCDLTDGHITLAADKTAHRREIEQTYTEWTGLGRPGLELWDQETTRARVASAHYVGALYDPHGGHLHPLNYTLGLARAAEAAGATIFCGTPMTRLDDGDPATVHTPDGQIRARFVLLAGNAHLIGREPRLKGRLMPINTYVATTRPLGSAGARALIPGNEAAADLYFSINYFRLTADHRLLFGGRVGYGRQAPDGARRAMQRTIARIFPHLTSAPVDHAWGGTIGITLNRLPDLGRVAPNVLYAHGYSGHGLALAGLAGKLVAEAMAGQSERFDVLARIPHRSFPGGTLLRFPLLALAGTWQKLRDVL